MNIQFEKLSARGSFIGANDLTRAPHHGADTRADLLAERSSALATRSHGLGARNDRASFDPLGSALEHGEPLQTLIDCLAMLAGFLLVSVTGVGLAFAVFCLFFVSLT